MEFARDFGYTPKQFNDLYLEEFFELIEAMSVTTIPSVARSLADIRTMLMGFFKVKEPQVVVSDGADIKFPVHFPHAEVSQKAFDKWLEAGQPDPRKFFKGKKVKS